MITDTATRPPPLPALTACPRRCCSSFWWRECRGSRTTAAGPQRAAASPSPPPSDWGRTAGRPSSSAWTTGRLVSTTWITFNHPKRELKILKGRIKKKTTKVPTTLQKGHQRICWRWDNGTSPLINNIFYCCFTASFPCYCWRDSLRDSNVLFWDNGVAKQRILREFLDMGS